MLTYNTGITNTPPITPAMRQQALDGLMAQRPASPYPGSFQDVYNGRASGIAEDMSKGFMRANNDYLAQTQAAQQQTALSGARQLAELQQNLNNLSNQRQQMALGYAQNMFGGINGLLQGLFN